MPKTKLIRQIDKAPRVKSGEAAESATVAVDFAPPALPRPLAPTNLQLTTATEFSTASPSARVSATWDPPPGVTPRMYVAQISESNTFPSAGTVTLYTRFDQESVDFSGRRPGITQYVRVAAVAQTQGPWSVTASIAAAQDLTPAGVPTSPAAAWIGTGDLLITWVNPTNANFKDVKIVVRASAGGTILRTWYSAAQQWVYTFAMNLVDTAGVPDNSLYVELQSRTFSDVLSATVNTGLVTKAAPATPTGLAHTWSGETANNGVAGADWTLSWTRANDAARYRVAINSVDHFVSGNANSYTYSHALNVNENTAPGDPTLSYSLYAVDAFGTSSTAASGTATNQNPPAPTVTLTEGAVAGIQATIAGTKAADFLAYEVVWKRDGTTVATVEGSDSVVRYEQQGAGDGGYHSWTAVVRQKDLFNQYSTATTSAAVAFEGLTLSYLRDGIEYTDSIGTAPATLKAALADGNTTSGGITYAA